MGGILIIFAIALTTLLLADLDNFYVGNGFDLPDLARSA